MGPVRFQPSAGGHHIARRRPYPGGAVMVRPVTAADAGVVLAQPRGFCAGVDRAIDIVERALELHGAPIYVRHEIVHNRYVVEALRGQGAIFLDELDQAHTGATVAFPATASYTAERPQP